MTEPKATEPTETTEYSPGGDMAAGTAHAHIETPEEIEAEPIDDAELARTYVESGGGKPPTKEESAELQRAAAASELPRRTVSASPVVESYKTQHAKVLRFEVSVGANDDQRTIEQFEADVRDALAKINGTSIHNITMYGGYYLIDGTVCRIEDYDPATKNRKPGTVPPPWAGGPVPGKGEPYQPPVYDTPKTVAAKGKSAKAVVTALAENMNQEVKAKS